jgi:hypothetical protein
MRDMMDARFGRSYEVLPPDPRESGSNWTPTANGVRAGFRQIKGIGEKMSHRIEEFQSQREITDWSDLTLVHGIGKKTIESIREFVNSDDPFNIHRIERETELLKRWIKEAELPLPDTLSTGIPFEPKRSQHVILGLVKDRQPQDMYENWRARTGEELKPEDVKDPHLAAYMTLFLEDTAGRITLKVNRWVYPRYQRILDSAKINHDYILARVAKKPYHGRAVHASQIWVIDPD